MDCLRIHLKLSASSGRRKTTASPRTMPFLVPPNETASTPTSVVKARSGRSSPAAAFASRAPSTWSRRPRSCAASASARSSSAL
jgi:hypothetical protein